MKQSNRTHRTAIALLLAGIALPLNPASGQAPAASPPPLVDAPPPTATAPAPAPAPVSLAPPPVVRAPAPRIEAAPAAEAPAATQPRTEPARTRAETGTATRRTSAPARAAPAADTPARAPAPAPVAETALPPAPPAALPPPVDLPPPADLPAATTEMPAEGTGAWPWLLVALGVAGLGLFAWMLMRRRRRSDEMVYEDEYHPVEEPASPARPDLAYFTPAAAAAALATPAIAQEPEPYVAPTAAVAPAADSSMAWEEPAEAVASADHVEITEPDAADVEALAADSRAPMGRPWLEFLMRPIRAGTTGDETRVEFELTVGNTGSVPAEDVRISTWMFAAGSAAESEMERMLIEPPADAKLSEVTIAAGDGARVEAALALPKTGEGEAVLPVVVADARYRLPDGSEGRTSASFQVGLPGEEALEPFPVDRTSGLLETVEARLHGDLERA
ncbi:hypothetical protein [Sphingosinicella terrae]|uniref:hypothetical protein n=1 Tax=Sphingosinicella terrae TaxID=2172047 RepID=UPI000E0D59F3|nr:hypothetical protein [Sphingosinicella terrae]